MLRHDLGDGACLRLFDERDVDGLQALIAANLEHLRPWLPWARQRVEATRDYVRDTRRLLADDEGLVTAIVDERGIAGAVGCHADAREHGVGRLGYWLAADRTGRGLATRAVRAHVDHAWDAWDLGRLEIHAAVDNAPSRALAERLGFTLEGVMRDAHRVDGRVQDLALYALLRRDWPDVRPAR